MYNNKYLLFTNGGGSADPLNWDSSEAVMYKIEDFTGMKPFDARSIDLFFNTDNGREIVTLNIKNGTHITVMTAISNALISSKQAVISIADVDNGNFIHKSIYDAEIKHHETYAQNLDESSSGVSYLADVKAKINLGRRNYSSCLVTNTTTQNVRMTLYLASQVGTDITDTGANVNNGSDYNAGDTSVIVDGSFGGTDAIRSDLFLDERVYKEDGTFIGICTAIHSSGTPLTFAAGLEVDVDDDENLHTGTRYHLTNELKIPRQDTLKLENNEISFNNSLFALYARSNRADGHLTFIFHY